MTFLFDIGKVLLDFDFESSLERLVPHLPDARAQLDEVLADKDCFEAGRVPLDEYLELALGVLGPTVTREGFIEAWRDIFTPNRPMWDVVDRLHADGHRLILFSNTNVIHCPWIFENYEVFRRFHGAVLSFEVGEIKPHDPIYEHAIGHHALDPAETLYVDDLPANIESGRRFGFRCHQYDMADHAAFERWLEEELAPGA